jgi:hypothetical protein
MASLPLGGRQYQAGQLVDQTVELGGQGVTNCSQVGGSGGLGSGQGTCVVDATQAQDPTNNAVGGAGAAVNEVNDVRATDAGGHGSGQVTCSDAGDAGVSPGVSNNEQVGVVIKTGDGIHAGVSPGVSNNEVGVVIKTGGGIHGVGAARVAGNDEGAIDVATAAVPPSVKEGGSKKTTSESKSKSKAKSKSKSKSKSKTKPKGDSSSLPSSSNGNNSCTNSKQPHATGRIQTQATGRIRVKDYTRIAPTDRDAVRVATAAGGSTPSLFDPVDDDGDDWLN